MSVQLSEIRERLLSIRKLEHDWDEDGAEPIDPDTIDSVAQWFGELGEIPDNVHIIPTFHRGVQVEWHKNGKEVEFEFSPEYPGEVFLFVVDGPEITEDNWFGCNYELEDVQNTRFWFKWLEAK